jgi:hypothetical protein
VDEYAMELNALRRTLARLREEEADGAVIDEYEAELRNLTALYAAAQETLDAGTRDPRLPRALDELGFGRWELPNVYSFVYEAAMDAESDGREVSSIVREIDFPASLLAALG